MTYQRTKVAPWEQFADGEWHLVRTGPQGESRDDSMRAYRRHYESAKAWGQINYMAVQLSRRENGRIIRVRMSPIGVPDPVHAAIKAMPPLELRSKLLATVRLLNYAFHLRVHGEHAPGGSETWREFDQRCETFLREING